LNKKEFFKSLIAFVFLFVIVIMLARYMNLGNHAKPEAIDYTTFFNSVKAGNVGEVTISGNDIDGKYKNGKEFRTSGPTEDKDLYALLVAENVKVDYKNAERNANIIQLVTWAVIILGGTFVFIYFLRQMQAA
jgi:cell division protease FtsH